jgi:hypothetical protein
MFTRVSDGEREGCTCCLRGRAPVVLHPSRIVVFPLRRAHRSQPLQGNKGETTESVPRRLADHLDPVQGTHRRENMARIGPLEARRGGAVKASPEPFSAWRVTLPCRSSRFCVVLGPRVR